MFSVYLSVYLSVCLLATSRKNYCWDLRGKFSRDVSFDTEETVKF